MAAEELKPRALELLEFDRIQQMLAERTSFEAARELALRLRPAYEAEEVARLRQQTAEASYLLSQRGDVELSAARDIRPLLQRASLEGVLSGEELHQVLQTLRVVRVARRWLLRSPHHTPALTLLAEKLPEFPELEQELEASIGDQGEVRDEATPELKRLREEVRSAHGRLITALNRILRSPLGREILQEPVITLRSERMVLPVKAEMKGRLRGLVHDVSDSGATVFIEPFTTVELGNAWRELLLEEQREVWRVLRRLTSLVGEHSQEMARAVAGLAALDLILAKARLGRSLEAALPVPEEGDQPRLRLINARHPLLKGRVVPISLEIAPQRPVLLITGPNAGGKTVALKTVGLLVLMNQAGLPLPAAAHSVLSTFDAVYADIGDFQSIEQARSSFTAHIGNIAAILSEVTPRSLVLLDELGTSTDPEEGSALAKGVLSYLAEAGITAVATGHHRAVATFVDEHPAMNNASVELDPVTLTPTFHLTMGLPGRSYAMAIASHLGLPGEVLSQARHLMEPGQARAEALLSQLQQERQAALKKREEAEAAWAEAERLRQELDRERADIAARREELLEGVRQELLERAEQARARLREAEKVLQGEATLKAVREALAQATAQRRQLRSEEWRPAASGESRWWHRLRPGDRVGVKGLNVVATVLSAPDREGQAEVLIGSTRARFPVEQLVPKEAAPGLAGMPRPQAPVLPAATGELNVRGKRVEDALSRVEEFVDRSALAGLATVRILHGQGTGALRRAIRERLSHHPLVRSVAAAELPLGGEGVTVVELK